MQDELWQKASPREGGYRELPAAAWLEADGLRVVDVREPGEFAGPLGHLEGAELVPLATIRAASEGWDRDRTIALVCRSGRRSAQAAKDLVARGFQRVINVGGGMIECGEKGLRVVREGEVGK